MHTHLLGQDQNYHAYQAPLSLLAKVQMSTLAERSGSQVERRRPVASQHTPIHHGGDHQPGDVIHLIATIRSFASTVVHLRQPEASFFHKAGSLSSLVFFCPAVFTVLLPASMSDRVKSERLGFSLTAGMAPGIQGTLLTSCSHEAS